MLFTYVEEATNYRVRAVAVETPVIYPRGATLYPTISPDFAYTHYFLLVRCNMSAMQLGMFPNNPSFGDPSERSCPTSYYERCLL